LCKERPGLRSDLFGEAERVREDLAVHLIGVLVIEGGKTGELGIVSKDRKSRKAANHLVKEDAEGPPVDAFRVTVSG